MKIQDHDELSQLDHRPPPALRKGSSDGAPLGFPGRAPGSRASHLGNIQSALLERITPVSTEAEIVIESWRRHYNTVRPHASIGYRAPAPEVFVPALAAWPAAQPTPAPPAMLKLVPRPTLN
jgi:hypothetical protein